MIAPLPNRPSIFGEALRDLDTARSAELERQIDANCRLLELARHNGFEIELEPLRDGRKLWRVPREFVPIAGYDGAIVR